MSSAVAYLNGQWVAADELSVPVDDFGFLMGVTVVERLRTFQGKPSRVAEHMQRLRRSLEIVDWDADRLVAEITPAIEEMMPRNAAAFSPGDDWYVVAFITPGKSADAREPTVCVHGGPLAFAAWAELFETGVKAVVTETREVPESCWPPEMKCRSRIHYYLADQEAAAKSPGARAILLDQEGFVSEASTANVVAYFPNRGLVTPPRAKVLPGVTQQALFEIANELGMEQTECDFTVEEMLEAAELFFTSTSICMLPVVEVDGQTIGNGQPGPIYQHLLAAWEDHTGVDVAAQARRFAQR